MSLPAPVAAPRKLVAVAGANRLRPRVTTWVLFSLVVVVAFFGLIYARIAMDHSAYDLVELERAIVEAEFLEADLELEIARLRDPGRIERLAVGLGMVYPEQRDLLVVDPAGIEGPGVVDRFAAGAATR